MRTLLATAWLICTLVLVALVQVSSVVAVGSWSSTILINTEAFQIIDDANSTSDLTLQFGGVLAKTLSYERAASRFSLDDDLYVDGNLFIAGTLTGAGIVVNNINGSATANSGSILVSQSVNAPIWRQPIDFFHWYIDGPLTVGTLQGPVYTLPYGFTVTDVELHAKGGPIGAALQVDINHNGTSIYSTIPEVDDGTTVEDDNEVLSGTTLIIGSTISLDIDQIGSTVSGSGLTVMLKGVRKYE